MVEREPGRPDAFEGAGGTADAAGATSFLQRAVIRRRVRFLRGRRELALHDLGGFVFEAHRLGEPQRELLAEKLAALSALDDELAALQRALALREELSVLHQPGIAACPHCGAIHDSAANFCPGCGTAAGTPQPEQASDEATQDPAAPVEVAPAPVSDPAPATDPPPPPTSPPAPATNPPPPPTSPPETIEQARVANPATATARPDAPSAAPADTQP